jgi:hypothetical protein
MSVFIQQYFFTILYVYKILENFNQLWPILQCRQTRLRVGSIRNFIACFDLSGGNDGFWVHVHRFTTRTQHNALPHLDPTGSCQPSRVETYFLWDIPSRSISFFNAFDYSKITDTLVESVRRCWRSTKIIFKSLSHFQSKIWSL